MAVFFGGSGSMTGYNCQQVNNLRDVINSTAESSASGIIEEIENGVIRPMADVWCAPEAVEFFNNFADAVRASGEAVTKAFDEFRAWVEGAGTNWAENTNGEVPSLPAIDLVDLNLNVSSIQNENNGNVFIDEAGATAVANSLPEVEENIKTRLSGLAQNLNAESAFMGNGQAEAAQECFVKVSEAVHIIFKFLTDGENSLQSSINSYVKKYQEVSQGIASAFNNADIH